MNYARSLLKGKKYSQNDLIPFIVLIIGTQNGYAHKYEVDEQLYNILQNEFSSEVYRETVANNVPRWKHDIAWAKERAKQIYGYIKSPDESGRGVWELTDKGKEHYQYLVKKIQSKVKIRKNQH